MLSLLQPENSTASLFAQTAPWSRGEMIAPASVTFRRDCRMRWRLQPVIPAVWHCEATEQYWLGLVNIQPAQAGDYRLIISNNFGAVTSAVASVSVFSPPEITGQPVSQSVVLGSNATFTVSAIGDVPLQYQWQRNLTNLTDGPFLAGSTSNMLTILNAQSSDAANYSVVISNAYGVVTSAVVTLTVNVPVAITIQPTNRTVLVGGNAAFNV